MILGQLRIGARATTYAALWPECVVLYSHWLHWCSLSPVCFLICVLRLEATLHEKLQCVHLCGFSPVWMREWVFKLASLLNDLLHCWQLYLTPRWVCLWLDKLLLLAKVFQHKSQGSCFTIFKYHLLFLLAISSDWIELQQQTTLSFVTFTFDLFQNWHLSRYW